jgi:hypothetical protein
MLGVFRPLFDEYVVLSTITVGAPFCGLFRL